MQNHWVFNLIQVYYMLCKIFLSKAFLKASVWGLIVVLWLLKLAYQCFTNWNCSSLSSISVSCFSFVKIANDNLWACVIICFTHHLMFWISYVQRVVRTREQVWSATRTQLVYHLHAVVAAVERLCQICE